VKELAEYYISFYLFYKPKLLFKATYIKPIGQQVAYYFYYSKYIGINSLKWRNKSNTSLVTKNIFNIYIYA